MFTLASEYHKLVQKLIQNEDISRYHAFMLKYYPHTENSDLLQLIFTDIDISKASGNTNLSLIEFSSMHGCANIVRLLLQNDKLFNDDSVFDHFVELACDYNHPEVLRLLLGDKRFDPSKWHRYDRKYSPIEFASRHGNIEMVCLLLEDDRLGDLNKDNSIGLAAKHNHFQILDLLLKHRKFDPCYDEELLNIVCKQGYVEVVRLLLEDKRIDPCLLAVTQACSFGYCEIVKIFMQDGRVKPGDWDMYIVSKRGCSDIVDLLSDDKSLDKNMGLIGIRRVLRKNGKIKNKHVKVIDILLWKIMGKIWLLCGSMSGGNIVADVSFRDDPGDVPGNISGDVPGDVVRLIQYEIISMYVEEIFGDGDLKYGKVISARPVIATK